MEEHKQVLSKGFSEFISRYNKFQLSIHNKETIQAGSEIISEGSSLLNLLKTHVLSLETVLSDCQDFMEEVVEDLAVEPKAEDFVFTTKKGMLSYKGRDFVPKKKTDEPTVVIPKQIKPKLQRVLIPEIGYYLKLNKVNKLSDIQPMLSYYDNPKDTENLPGLYCTLLPGVHVRIPFPNVVDSTKEYGRGHSIRCKYISKELCDNQRGKMASFHKSQVRTCNFAHTGQKIVKIGYPSRCSRVSFGDAETLTRDIKSIKLPDIKNILLYGLNDIMSSIVWMDCNSVANTVYSNVDMA